MRWTTRIATALLVAVLLALTFYAYPSVPGFMTLFVRTASILTGLSLLILLIAVFSKRRPGWLGIDIALVLSAVGLLAASWGQLSAKMDADALASEIEAAGESEVFAVLAVTDTDTGAAVRDAFTLRDTANGELEVLLTGLWDPADLVAVTGPQAEDAEALGVAMAAAEADLETVAGVRAVIRSRIDAEIEAIQEIHTPLPDSARLTFVDQAIQEAEADRDYYLQRISLIGDRIGALSDAATILSINAGNYSYDATAEAVSFMDGGARVSDAAARYSVALTNIDLSLDEEAALIAVQEDGTARIAAALRLVEAASTTP